MRDPSGKAKHIDSSCRDMLFKHGMIRRSLLFVTIILTLLCSFQTVADDAYILLFQPGHLTGRTEGVITDSAGKAQALAALVLLGDGVSTLNDSLRVYLESAELRLAQIYQRFHTGSIY